MEYFYPRGQFLVAFYFALVGALLCLLYDVFRIKREFFGSSRFVMFVDDFVYMLICAVCVILGILKINSGNVRWYETFFAVFGFVLYRKTLSKVVTSFFFILSRLVKKLMSFVLVLMMKLILPVVRPFVRLFAYQKKAIIQLYHKILLFNYKNLFVRKMCKSSLITGEI